MNRWQLRHRDPHPANAAVEVFTFDHVHGLGSTQIQLARAMPDDEAHDSIVISLGLAESEFRRRLAAPKPPARALRL